MQPTTRKIPWGLNLIKDLNILFAVLTIFSIVFGSLFFGGSFIDYSLSTGFSLSMLSTVIGLIAMFCSIFAVHKKLLSLWKAVIFLTVINWFIPPSLEAITQYFLSGETYIFIGIELAILVYWFKMRTYFDVNYVFANDIQGQRIDKIFKKTVLWSILIAIIAAAVYFMYVIPKRALEMQKYHVAHSFEEGLRYCDSLSEDSRNVCFITNIVTQIEKEALSTEQCLIVSNNFVKNVCLAALERCDLMDDVDMKDICLSESNISAQ